MGADGTVASGGGTGMSADDTIVSVGGTRSRARPNVLVAAALALALVSGVATYLLVKRPAGGRATGFSALSSSEIKLLNGSLTLYEQPSDPVRLTSFVIGQDITNLDRGNNFTTAYVRGETAFTEVGGDDFNASISPDGRWLAVVDEMYFYHGSDRFQVRITDRATDETFAVRPALDRRETAMEPSWSPDGGRLLFTLADHSAGQNLHTGFLIVDPAGRTSSVVKLRDASDRESPASADFYRWGPGSQTVLGPSGYSGASLMDLSGRTLRSLHWVGRPIGVAPFAPSGGRFFTLDRNAHISVWDYPAAKRLATVPGIWGDDLIAWYDEDHLIVGRSTPGTYEAIVVDLAGKRIRVLARLERDENRSELPAVELRYSRTPVRSRSAPQAASTAEPPR
ncbi:hypothetical protein ACQP2T_53980 [Nonomuraea sp. CA-143628]|uniref:hypothetical protein n=1 Tax=Nonomuraea sp. CA-143628 TaxID=3239997 RepID=UPI003D938A8A